MVNYCCVPNCKGKFGNGLSFHRFPKDKLLLKDWCHKLRMGKNPSKTMVVCSQHFTKEDFKPKRLAVIPSVKTFRNNLKETAVPSLNLPVSSHPSRKLVRSDRRKKLSAEFNVQTHDDQNHEPVSLKEDSVINNICPWTLLPVSETAPIPVQNCNEDPGHANLEVTSALEDCWQSDMLPVTAPVTLPNYDEDHGHANVHSALKDCCLKDVPLVTEIDAEVPSLTDEVAAAEALLALNKEEAEQVESIRKTQFTKEASVMCNVLEDHICRISPGSMLASEIEVRTLTGLNSMELFESICSLYSTHYKLRSATCNTLGTESKILLTFMKLKLGLSYNALAALFKIGRTTAADIFKVTITRLSKIMKCCIVWLSKKQVVNNLPKCFEQYKETRVILDCTEIPVESTSCLKCRILTYSHYKKMHTCKVLIGIAPSGVITFLSQVYGGRASDKFITEESGVLDLCTPFRDCVMVDKGFKIDNMCRDKSLTFLRPAYLRKKKQLSENEGHQSASISSARVHVERAISKIKIFEIFQKKLPWEILPYIDSILTVCCACVNLSPPIMSDDKFM